MGIPADLSEDPSTYSYNFNNSGDTLSGIDATFSFLGLNLIGHFSGGGDSKPRGIIEIDPSDRSRARLEYEFQNEDFIVNARILQ